MKIHFGSTLWVIAAALQFCGKEQKGTTTGQHVYLPATVPSDTIVKFGSGTVGLVTDILNLPSVIKFSRIEVVRKQYDWIYGRIYGFDLEQDSL